MRFPLGDWIDNHRDCRHDLGESGMHGTIAPGLPSRIRFDRGVIDDLRDRLASDLGVSPRRLFLTHGATEANAWVAFHVARRPAGRGNAGRVRFPEYPPLVDLLGTAGFRVVDRAGPAAIAAVSRPRNPEGELWSRSRLFDWAEGARHLLVDETFREFSEEPTLAREGRRGLWTTGTFTKFWGADHVRVGFAIAPPEEAEEFGRFIGLVSDELAPASAAEALALLGRRAKVRREVLRVLDRNRAYLRKADPTAPVPVGPVYFDRTVATTDRLADRCLAASVLVCPGRFFGDRSGVRIGLTRRSFPRDLDAYLAVRRTMEGGPVKGTGARGPAQRRRTAASRGDGGRR